MDKGTKELIAVGAAVTACCIPCLKFHYAKALQLGVSGDELAEAIRIGRMVRKGSATTWDEEIDRFLG